MVLKGFLSEGVVNKSSPLPVIHYDKRRDNVQSISVLPFNAARDPIESAYYCSQYVGRSV